MEVRYLVHIDIREIQYQSMKEWHYIVRELQASLSSNYDSFAAKFGGSSNPLIQSTAT